MPTSALELSHAIDLFLHKDRTSYFDNVSLTSDSVTSQETTAFPPLLPSFHWDLQRTSRPMLPAFQYISHKLCQRELSVALIISDHEPYVIPVWPLPRRSQLILAKIIRKACRKFLLEPSWLTAVASLSNKCLPKIFEAYQPDSYIVRRSIVQNDIVYSDEGLTLLSMDNIYTFKQLLCTLSKPDWVANARDVCLSSCVHLLKRIHEVYTDPKLSRGYLARVYKEIEFKQVAFEEVTSAFSTNYCTASIRDVTMLEPDYTALTDNALDWASDDEGGAAELPDSSTGPDHSSNSSHGISPIATVDLSTLDSWETKAPGPTDVISPLERVKYPSIRRPSSVRESLVDPMAPWSFPIRPPLRTLNSRRTIENQNADLSAPASAPLLNPERRISEGDSQSPLESTDSWSSSEVMQSPLRWLESWSTNAPSLLCQNCHDTMNLDVRRRFTFA
ncbi:MAG: hypothetical protein ALECFALPRED_005875 [Alectoria fallacina]|uniref:DUF7582 domain-containing protein n=1 Tax=Alectoria fallacina TaxID=1903189 RepID=A0A8H3IYI9_9LECA|nr:MAG: hypothetical protein ALECFALPRED_005875 [Alectoria fallacina]